MNRSHFLQSLVAAAAGHTFFPSSSLSGRPTNAFKLNYAPHEGLFKHLGGATLKEHLSFMHNQGFTAFEDNNLRKRPVKQQELIGEFLRNHNMQMGTFVAHSIGWQQPNLVLNSSNLRSQFITEINESIPIARRVDATWMTVVPGLQAPNLSEQQQTTNLVQTLKQAARLLEPHNLVMILEPLNTITDHPRQFLTTTKQAHAICEAVDSPSCKILYDVYHQQITEGNLIPNMRQAWDEIAYIQVADNPGRNEPTTGEINYKNIFRFLADMNYKGMVGMEHGTAQKEKMGEAAVIEAYRNCDPS